MPNNKTKKPKHKHYRWEITFEPANDFQEKLGTECLDAMLICFGFSTNERHKLNKVEWTRYPPPNDVGESD